MEADKDNELGEFIRKARGAIHLSIRQAAALAELHYSFWSRIETGDRRKIDPRDLQRIAEVLQIDPGELLEFIGVEQRPPEPVVYFRQTYGMSEQEATEAAEIIEDLQVRQRERKARKGGSHD